MDDLQCLVALAIPPILGFAYLYIFLTYTKRGKTALDKEFSGPRSEDVQLPLSE